MLTCKPSLKTVDSLFFTGEKEHARKSVTFAAQHSLTQRKRTKADTGSIDGPAIYITSAGCELLSKLLFSQNATSLSNGDVNSPLYQSLPLNVKYIVDVESSLTVCAHGADITKFNDPAILVWNLNDNKQFVAPSHTHDMKLTMTCLRETATNAHNLDRPGIANHDAILLGWNKCKRNIAYGMFLVGHSSMGECALAECAPAESSFLNSRIDSLKPVSISANFVAVDQYYDHGCSSSEPGSGVVLAINDNESVDTSMGVLNTIMDDDDKDSVDASKRTLNDIVDEFDNSLTNDHESAFLYMMDMPDVQPDQTSGEGVE